MAAGDVITAIIFNGFIDSMNAERTRRALSGPEGHVTADNVIPHTYGTSEAGSLTAINAAHCYCQSGQSPTIATHNGGKSITLTTESHDYSAGTIIYSNSTAGLIAHVNTDRNALAAQCACNSYGQTTTSTHVCECNTYCDCEEEGAT